jgi:hypothetical protein
MTPDYGLRRRKAAEFARADLLMKESAAPQPFRRVGNIFDHVGLQDIGAGVLQDWRRQWDVDTYLRDQKDGGWNWATMHAHTQRAHLNHFAVSAYLDGNFLFMLCIGRLTQATLVITHLERAPRLPKDFAERFGALRGLAATCAFAAAEAYARLSGRPALVLNQPLSGVVDYYIHQHGFAWAPGTSGELVLSRRVS